LHHLRNIVTTELSLANLPGRLCGALQLRREKVREGQRDGFEVQAEARGLLKAMVGEL